MHLGPYVQLLDLCSLKGSAPSRNPPSNGEFPFHFTKSISRGRLDILFRGVIKCVLAFLKIIPNKYFWGGLPLHLANSQP